jgi:DNA-binding transcriptional LysR family regulator
VPAIRRPTDYRVDPFDLRLFATVLELGTITAAAQAASLSLAAASTRLKGLEVLVGTKLLDRSKSGAVPTDAGRALARSARRVLAEVESLHVEMAAFGSGLRGTVRLLCNTAAIAEAVPPRLGRFLIRHADIDVELQEMPSDAVLDALRRGAGDVGIVADHVDTSGLVTQTWLEDRLVALVPRHMALRAARSVHFVQLLDQPFVGLSAEGGLSRFLLQQASRSGRVPRHRVRVTNFDAAAQLVAAGVGVAVMPFSAAVRWRAATVRIVPLKDAWAKRRLIICATAEASDRPGVHALLEAMIAA